MGGGWWYPSMPCRSPGPHPVGRLRGLARGFSRPTPRGEAEGSGRGVSRPTPRWGCVQAHTQGVSRPTPMEGGLQAQTHGGCFPACTEADTIPQADSYCCGRYASYWNASLFDEQSLVCAFTYWLNRIILEHLLHIFMDRNCMLFLSMLHCDH